MKRILLSIIGLLLLVPAFGQTHVEYYYHWEKSVGTPDAEDVVLRCVWKKGKLTTVSMYCTTDEWDEARVGYLPGFTLWKDGLPEYQKSGRIRLNFYPQSVMSFSTPISTNYKSIADAWKSGKYHAWIGSNRHIPQKLTYELTVNSDGSFTLYGQYYKARHFQPMSASKVLSINRNQYTPAMEAANRLVDPIPSSVADDASAMVRVVNDTITFPFAHYKGDLALMKSGARMRHGHGQVLRADSMQIECDWKWNVPQNWAKMTFRNGTVYEGECKDLRPNGKGKFIYSVGSYYDGEVKDGVRQGYGSGVFPNGDTYRGQWANGKPNGFGLLTQYSKKTSSHGMFQDGKYVGPVTDPEQEKKYLDELNSHAGKFD